MLQEKIITIKNQNILTSHVPMVVGTTHGSAGHFTAVV
jgi:hypothetical protein